MPLRNYTYTIRTSDLPLTGVSNTSHGTFTANAFVLNCNSTYTDISFRVPNIVPPEIPNVDMELADFCQSTVIKFAGAASAVSADVGGGSTYNQTDRQLLEFRAMLQGDSRASDITGASGEVSLGTFAGSYSTCTGLGVFTNAAPAICTRGAFEKVRIGNPSGRVFRIRLMNAAGEDAATVYNAGVANVRFAWVVTIQFSVDLPDDLA